jgi:hypothetical protein
MSDRIYAPHTLLEKLRLAAIRNDEAAMASTTNALSDLGPAQDVVVESARAPGFDSFFTFTAAG